MASIADVASGSYGATAASRGWRFGPSQLLRQEAGDTIILFSCCASYRHRIVHTVNNSSKAILSYRSHCCRSSKFTPVRQPQCGLCCESWCSCTTRATSTQASRESQPLSRWVNLVTSLAALCMHRASNQDESQVSILLRPIVVAGGCSCCLRVVVAFPIQVNISHCHSHTVTVSQSQSQSKSQSRYHSVTVHTASTVRSPHAQGTAFLYRFFALF
jgi:hypothetical protein